MTRWLEAARRALPPAAKTDKRDGTQPAADLVAPEGDLNPVLSDLSVLLGRVDTLAADPAASTRAAIIAALRAGLKTPGAIATAAKLGATVTYQELDRMAREGLVIQAANGALRLTFSPFSKGPNP